MKIGDTVLSLSNNVTNEVIKTGKVDNWSGGYIGLLMIVVYLVILKLQILVILII